MICENKKIKTDYFVGISSPYERFLLAGKMNVCIPGFHPVLFKFTTTAQNQWVTRLVAVSGRVEGRIDGVRLLETVLKDAKKFNENQIKILKRIIVADKGKNF